MMENKIVYPFVVNRNKVVKIDANTYDNALNKILAKHPVQIVQTKFARNLAGYKRLKPAQMLTLAQQHTKVYKPFRLIINTMDLITAKVEAAKASRDKRKKMYINVDDEGECIISSIPAKNTDMIQAVFVNGSEVKLEEHLNENEQKTTNKMETTVKTAKKTAPAKKVAAKKKAKAPAKKVASAKKSAAKTSAPSVTAANLTQPAEVAIKDVIKKIKSGEVKAYNKDLKPLPMGYLAKMVDHNKVITVSYSK